MATYDSRYTHPRISRKELAKWAHKLGLYLGYGPYPARARVWSGTEARSFLSHDRPMDGLLATVRPNQVPGFLAGYAVNQ